METAMKMLAYKGIGLISKAIQIQTDSPYSHIGILLKDQTVVEAWHRGGVSHVRGIGTNHKTGTPVDVFDITCPFDEEVATKWLLMQVGKRYDFAGVARFVARRIHEAPDKWFCSELGEQTVITGGGRLLRGSPSRHAPAHTVMSPFIRYAWSEICRN